MKPRPANHPLQRAAYLESKIRSNVFARQAREMGLLSTVSDETDEELQEEADALRSAHYNKMVRQLQKAMAGVDEAEVQQVLNDHMNKWRTRRDYDTNEDLQRVILRAAEGLDR